MSRDLDPEQMTESAKELIHDLIELQNRVRRFAWVVSTQDEDLFEALVKLAQNKQDMANHSSRFPADKDKSYADSSEEYRSSWSKLCQEQARLMDKLAAIGQQFQESKDSV